MMLLALPPFASELVAALLALVVTLGFVRAKRQATIHDPEAEIQQLTARVRFQANHPVRYRVVRFFWAKD
jgi:hypothetical protein